jgi:hypothetical protein
VIEDLNLDHSDSESVYSIEDDKMSEYSGSRQYKSKRSRKQRHIDVMRVNFDPLTEEQKEFTDEQSNEEVKKLESNVVEMTKELRNYNPNLKAKEKFKQLEDKMGALDQEIETKMDEGQNTEEE